MEVLWLNKITSELFVLLLFSFGIGGMRNWKSSCTSSNPTVGLNFSSNRAKKLLCIEAESQSVAFQSEIELSSSFWSYRPDTFWGNFCFSGNFSQDYWFKFSNMRFLESLHELLLLMGHLVNLIPALTPSINALNLLGSFSTMSLKAHLGLSDILVYLPCG